MYLKELHKLLLERSCYATYVEDSVNGDYIVLWLTEFSNVDVKNKADLLKALEHPAFNNYDCRPTDIHMVNTHKMIYEIVQELLNAK